MGEIFSFGRGIALLRAATSVSPRPELTPGPTFDPLSLLLAETAAGSESAFARLYELTGGRLLSIADGRRKTRRQKTIRIFSGGATAWAPPA